MNRIGLGVAGIPSNPFSCLRPGEGPASKPSVQAGTGEARLTRNGLVSTMSRNFPMATGSQFGKFLGAEGAVQASVPVIADAGARGRCEPVRQRRSCVAARQGPRATPGETHPGFSLGPWIRSTSRGVFRSSDRAVPRAGPCQAVPAGPAANRPLRCRAR